jgi:hypothetical protein
VIDTASFPAGFLNKRYASACGGNAQQVWRVLWSAAGHLLLQLKDSRSIPSHLFVSRLARCRISGAPLGGSSGKPTLIVRFGRIDKNPRNTRSRRCRD